MKRIPLFLFYLLGTVAVSRAQLAKLQVSPEELAKKADVICSGTAIKVEVIEVTQPEDLLNYKPAPAKRVTVARIKVLSTVKGVVPDEIEVRYPVYDERFAFSNEPVPNHIKVEPGTRYRFYLKRVEGELWYVGALDGEANDGVANDGVANDGVAVQADEEREGTGPLLTKKEAVEIATAYYLKIAPKAIFNPKLTIAGYAKDQFPKWEVKFYSIKQMTVDPRNAYYDARIIVNRDKSVDEGSVVFARFGIGLDGSYAGKLVELTFADGKQGEPRTIRCVIREVDATTITVMPQPGKKPAVISKSAILRMRLLPGAQ